MGHNAHNNGQMHFSIKIEKHMVFLIENKKIIKKIKIKLNSKTL